MNSSVIIDDIRKRSIRVQRDQILEQIRREEEIDNMSIPKRFILEAEERARERIQGQGWKKTLFLSLVVLVGGFLLIKFLRGMNPISSSPPPRKICMEMEIQTEEDISSKKTVRFEEDPEEEFSTEINKFERLMEEFPTNWKNFYQNFSPEGMISDITGNLHFDFYDEENKIGVDFDPEDFFQFPNSLTNDEIRFQNMIYDKKIKRAYCEEKGIEYYEFTL